MKKIFIIFLIFSANIFVVNAQEAKKGILDLQNFDFTKNAPVVLNGEWHFYWKNMLNPDQIEAGISKNSYIDITTKWADAVQTSEGYATYSLTVILPKNAPLLAMELGEVFSSYKLWVNGTIFAENGKVGTNKDETVAGFVPVIKPLVFESDTLKLVMQVANFDHRHGGFFAIPRIDSFDELNGKHTNKVAYDLFLFGSILIMALYHFGLFQLNRRRISVLYFGILAAIIALRTLFTGTEFISNIFPNISWYLSYRIEYFTFFSSAVFFLLFIHSVFREESSKIFVNIIIVLGVLFNLSLIFPPKIFTKTAIPYQLIVMTITLFSIFVLVKAIIRKRQGAVVLFLSAGSFLLLVINDIVFYQFNTDSIDLTPFGLFILILGQSYLLASRFNTAFVNNEVLNEKLDYQNKNLEKIVELRTHKIQIQKAEILGKNEELQQINEELNTQKEEIADQKSKIENQHKMIKSSINYASTIQRVILPTQEQLDKHFNNFNIYLPKDVVSGDFYWMGEVKNMETNANYLFIAVVDCTGHGVPGAFMSMIGSRLLNSLVNEKNIVDPSVILHQMDENVRKILKQEISHNSDGMDMIICRIEKQGKKTKLLYSGAKNDLYVFENENTNVVTYKATRRSIGGKHAKAKEIGFENHEIILKENDVIYMSTDGYKDQNNRERQRIGSVKLKELIRKTGKESMDKQKEQFEQFLIEWKQYEKQRDDIALIGIKI